MKIPLKWLRDYVDITLAADCLAQRLTMAGLEVIGVERIGGSWENIVIGEVVAVNRHPNADRLSLVTVDPGGGQVTVVCGAPNVAPGQKVAFAGVGARLIDGHSGEAVVLKAARIRGVVSEGMVCSEKELGISGNHEETLVLPPDGPVGTALRDYLGDVVLDLDVTPNRPDCLSLIGIAREVAALTGESLRLPAVDYQESGCPVGELASVEITEPDLCPRYCASVITGIRIGPSPAWLQQRLASCGMRPINNVVDVTNYVMLEFGQPLHAFDLHKIEGSQIIVRRARDREPITTLDGIERTLNAEVLVIADKERAVAVAGIMGGLSSQVTATTDSVLIESASFNQAAVRRGCNHLRVQSEASIRFDKGLSRELPLLPLRRATQLLLELSGGRVARGIIDVFPGKLEPGPICLAASEVERISGLKVSTAETTRVLGALGFECRQSDADARIAVSPPYWRSDVSCPADLVEEVVRIIGYDKVPVTRLGAPLPPQRSKSSMPERWRDLRERLREVLIGFGCQEILTYSLVSLQKLEKLSPKLELDVLPLKVANPMTREQECLRTSLRAGLLATASQNQKSEPAGIRLFEIGKVFLGRGQDLPEESEMLCAVLCGPRSELSWHGDREMLGFFDVKGMVEALMRALRLRASFGVSDDRSLVAGRRADAVVEDEKVGILGEVHPAIVQAFELSGTVCLLEVDLQRLLPKVARTRACEPIPRFPSSSRDVALVLDEHVPYSSVEGIIRGFPLVREAVLFDVYRGDQVPEGKKSYAVRIVYQSPSHTLTDEEVEHRHREMLDKLGRELGATLR
jgi:phenylalanyl-tRNA synthetase beta chain